MGPPWSAAFEADGSPKKAATGFAKKHGVAVEDLRKQTTDKAHVAKLRALAVEFSATYFSGEDLEHIQEPHGEPPESGHR